MRDNNEELTTKTAITAAAVDSGFSAVDASGRPLVDLVNKFVPKAGTTFAYRFAAVYGNELVSVLATSKFLFAFAGADGLKVENILDPSDAPGSDAFDHYRNQVLYMLRALHFNATFVYRIPSGGIPDALEVDDMAADVKQVKQVKKFMLKNMPVDVYVNSNVVICLQGDRAAYIVMNKK